MDSIAAAYFVSISLIAPDLQGLQKETLSQNIIQAVCFHYWVRRERKRERDREEVREEGVKEEVVRE